MSNQNDFDEDDEPCQGHECDCRKCREKDAEAFAESPKTCVKCGLDSMECRCAEPHLEAF